MRRYFNTEGQCEPEEHYMIRIDDRLEKIKRLLIADMLLEYENDNQTGMDINAVAEEIYRYTSGYPYLVSAICKILDEELRWKDRNPRIEDIWFKDGIERHVICDSVSRERDIL